MGLPEPLRIKLAPLTRIDVNPQQVFSGRNVAPETSRETVGGSGQDDCDGLVWRNAENKRRVRGERGVANEGGKLFVSEQLNAELLLRNSDCCVPVGSQLQ